MKVNNTAEIARNHADVFWKGRIIFALPRLFQMNYFLIGSKFYIIAGGLDFNLI
jgi:hypothetical protein